MSVRVPPGDVCVRKGTSNAMKGRKKRENQNNLNDSYIAIHYTFWRYFGTCLRVYSARLSEKKESVWVVEKKRNWNIDSFRLWRLREKSFELCQTQQRSLSLSLPFSFSLMLLNSTEIEKKRKGNQSSMGMWKWKNYWRRHCIIHLLHIIEQTLNGTNNSSVYSSYIFFSFTYVTLINSDKTSNFFYYIYPYFVLLPKRWATTTITLPTYIFIFFSYYARTWKENSKCLLYVYKAYS